MDNGDLPGTTWTLLRFETDAGALPAVPDAPATIAFAPLSQPSEGGSNNEQADRVSGTGGCNRYFGSYTLTDNHLTLGPLAATRMLCSPERMAQEDRFFHALGTADSYELRDGQLVITYAEGRLRFEPASAHPAS